MTRYRFSICYETSRFIFAHTHEALTYSTDRFENQPDKLVCLIN